MLSLSTLLPTDGGAGRLSRRAKRSARCFPNLGQLRHVDVHARIGRAAESAVVALHDRLDVSTRVLDAGGSDLVLARIGGDRSAAESDSNLASGSSSKGVTLPSRPGAWNRIVLCPHATSARLATHDMGRMTFRMPGLH